MNQSVPHKQSVPSATICLAVLVIGAAMGTIRLATTFAQSDRDQAADQTQQIVDRQILRLNSDKLADREDAKQRLLKLGSSVLPLLPPDRTVTDAERRSSLNSIRQLLWKQKAVESTEASYIPASEVRTVGHFVEGLKRSGNLLDVDLPQSVLNQELKLPDPPAPGRTFWQVVNALEQQAPVAVRVDGSPPLLHFIESTTNQRPAVCLTGPFRIEATSVGLRDVIGRDDVQLLRIQFSLMTEPRLRPLFLMRNGRSLAVTFDGGMAAPFSPEASIELPLGQRGMQVGFHADFLVARDRIPQAIDVQGLWRMQLSGGREPFRFALSDSSVGARRRKAGVTVGLEQVVRGSDNGEETVDVVIAISYRESGRAFESHRNWLGKNDIRLEDKAGKSVLAERMDIELQVDGSAWLRYRFRPNKMRPITVVYEAPTLIMEARIPIKFSGLRVLDRHRDVRK